MAQGAPSASQAPFPLTTESSPPAVAGQEASPLLDEAVRVRPLREGSQTPGGARDVQHGGESEESATEGVRPRYRSRAPSTPLRLPTTPPVPPQLIGGCAGPDANVLNAPETKATTDYLSAGTASAVEHLRMLQQKAVLWVPSFIPIKYDTDSYVIKAPKHHLFQLLQCVQCVQSFRYFQRHQYYRHCSLWKNLR
jgi:hypothetical protein